MLLNMHELLRVADEGHFAVPAFNISSYAMFNGIMDISERKDAPVIIEMPAMMSSIRLVNSALVSATPT